MGLDLVKTRNIKTQKKSIMKQNVFFFSFGFILYKTHPSFKGGQFLGQKVGLTGTFPLDGEIARYDALV